MKFQIILEDDELTPHNARKLTEFLSALKGEDIKSTRPIATANLIMDVACSPESRYYTEHQLSTHGASVAVGILYRGEEQILVINARLLRNAAKKPWSVKDVVNDLIALGAEQKRTKQRWWEIPMEVLKRWQKSQG